MNKAGMEQALRNAMNDAPAISFTELASMPYVKVAEHDSITRQKEKKSMVYTGKLMPVAAFCLLFLIFISGWIYNYRVTDSVITLDVNPSIEIRTNRMNQILSIRALNEDAKEVLKDYHYNGRDMGDSVSALIESLMEHQYFKEDTNAMLLTVMNKNNRKADAVMNDMDQAIRKSLKSRRIAPTIMKQVISKEQDRSQLAEQYHISEGKMELIQDIISSSHKYTIDMLAGMTIEQLLNIAKESSVDLRKYLSGEDKAAISSASGKETDTGKEKGAGMKEDVLPEESQKNLGSGLKNPKGQENQGSESGEDNNYEKNETQEDSQYSEEKDQERPTGDDREEDENSYHKKHSQKSGSSNTVSNKEDTEEVNSKDQYTDSGNAEDDTDTADYDDTEENDNQDDSEDVLYQDSEGDEDDNTGNSVDESSVEGDPEAENDSQKSQIAEDSSDNEKEESQDSEEGHYEDSNDDNFISQQED